MNARQVLDALQEVLLSGQLEARQVPLNETLVTLSPATVHAATRLLVERFDLRHLSAITGEDTEEGIVLLYHFWDGQGLTLRTLLEREEAHVATLTDLIPGAAFFEREVSELLGVTFDGHPDPRRLLLPDDWEEEPPLRENWEEEREDAK
jgi:NADH:ubiquinone oxidoreductase subunit C